MQIRSQNPPLQYEPDIGKLIWKFHAKIHEEREKAMATNQAQTLMDYHTPTIGGANTIQLPDLPKGVTFDFKHRFLQMLDKNLFSGAAHEDPMWYMRKFIKLTNTVR